MRDYRPSRIPGVSYLLLISLFFCLALSACEGPGLLSREFAPTPSATPAPTVADLPDCLPGTYSISFVVEGDSREYRLHVPERLARPVALVIALHGFGGTAESMEAYTGFSTLADEQGFLAAYPQGLGSPATWELGPQEGNRDVSYIGLVLDDVLQRCQSDPGRIYVAGHSMGGGMANRLACNLAGRIAAIAAVSGAFFRSDVCSPSRPLPVLAIHGLADSTIPYAGSVNGVDNPENLPAIPSWAAAWGERNGCTTTLTTTFTATQINGSSWENCTDQANVVLYAIAGAGHGWPYQPLNASEVIWQFFKDPQFRRY
jgi:polyhydroxybutyrate depolymerase